MPKAKRSIQYKNFNFKIHDAIDDDDKGLITGYAATFGNMDLGFDIIDKGAFKKTLSESKGKFPILANHNSWTQIGWNLTASEDSKGLLVTGDLDIKNNTLAKERFSLTKKALEIGADSGLSIGFYAIQDEPDSENPRIRHLKEIKLMEYSFVTFPMNTEAMATVAKSWIDGKADANLNEHVDWFYKHLEQLGFNHSDVREQLKNYSLGNKPFDPNPVIQSIDECIKLINS